MNSTKMKVLLVACTGGILATECLRAESRLSPPAPTADVVKAAVFGQSPTTAQIETAERLRLYSPGSLQQAIGTAVAPFATASGAPHRVYLYFPESAGGAGSYQFGWAQELMVEEHGQLGQVAHDYYYAFFQDGVPTFYSRKSFNRCLSDDCRTWDSVVRNPLDNCLVPANTAGSAGKTCAQLGDAVEMASDYTVQESNGTFVVRSGMTVSDVKRAAKAVGAFFKDHSPDRLSIGTSLAIPGPLEVFLLRDGRVYARKLHQDEFPNK
jgi:hypothetical protein